MSLDRRSPLGLFYWEVGTEYDGYPLPSPATWMIFILILLHPATSIIFILIQSPHYVSCVNNEKKQKKYSSSTELFVTQQRWMKTILRSVGQFVHQLDVPISGDSIFTINSGLIYGKSQVLCFPHNIVKEGKFVWYYSMIFFCLKY